MKKIQKQLILLSLFFMILLTAAGCGAKDGETSGKTEVRIAYFPNITHTQALVMKNQGTLEEKWKDTCNVTWTSFNAGPAEIEAIFAGEIDLGYIGAVLLVRKDSGIASVKDLAGKKVAVPQLGNTQHLCLLSLLSENGLKTIDQGGDVTINASSNADILNLIDNGSVEAAVVPEPWGTTIEKNGNAEILLDYDELFLNGEYPSAVVIANGDFMEEHPEYVKEFLELHKEATLFINENLKEAQEIVNSEIESVTGKSIAADVLESAFSRMTADSSLNTEAVMTFANISEEEGFTSKLPEEEDVFNTEFNQ